MARRRYLVAYDIRDERRLRQIAVCMEGYGERIQYSVFVCDLSERERVEMRRDVELLMKPSEDSVMVVDLGPAGDSSRFLFLGQHERLPSPGRAAIV
jgi:CRISPR-associated protein Cas2